VSTRWGESLYEGSAEFYAVGRLPYPPGLAVALQQHLAIHGNRRLLDLGCGPGSLTLPLASLFRAVLAVDADPDMLRVGSVRAAEQGVVNVDWLHSRAEDLPADLGNFDCVTLAQSFHWMDRPVVARWIKGALAADGSCVHVGATTHEGVRDAPDLPHPAPPREAITELVQAYLGPHRRAGRQVITGELPTDEDAVFQAAGFEGPEHVEVPGGTTFERTEDEIVASVFSLSSAAPHHFGIRLPAFEADLRALLRRASPEGRFAERQRDVTLSIWRT
jgi:SAM-dependent methyltransferase